MPRWVGYVCIGIPLGILVGAIITAMIADEDARKIIFFIMVLVALICMFTYGLSIITQ